MGQEELPPVGRDGLRGNGVGGIVGPEHRKAGLGVPGIVGEVLVGAIESHSDESHREARGGPLHEEQRRVLGGHEDRRPRAVRQRAAEVAGGDESRSGGIVDGAPVGI